MDLKESYRVNKEQFVTLIDRYHIHKAMFPLKFSNKSIVFVFLKTFFVYFNHQSKCQRGIGELEHSFGVLFIWQTVILFWIAGWEEPA